MRLKFIDSRDAARFLTQYYELMGLLVNDVQGTMRSAVDELMEHAEHLDRLATPPRDGSPDKQAELVIQREESLNDLVLAMMGTLSAEDVTRQQVDHIVDAVQLLNKLLKDLMRFRAAGEGPDFEKAKIEVLRQLKEQFTMESEKRALNNAFVLDGILRKVS